MSNRLRQRRPGVLLRSRAAAMVAGAIVATGCALALAWPSHAMLLYHLLFDGAIVLLWIAAAAGWGTIVLRGIAPDLEETPASALAVTTIGLGLGILSLLVLALGLARALNTVSGWLLLVSGVVTLIILHRSGIRALLARCEVYLVAPAGPGWLWLSVMPLLGTTFVAAMVQPGLLWRDEPNGYDVVEYHLQVPRQWHDAGRIYPLHENVFSFFPMGVEMHFLLAMHLDGGPFNAMYLCQLMHLTFCVLAIMAVRSFSNGPGGLVAALSMAGVPWLALLAPIAYVEGGTLFFGVLSVAWVVRALDRHAISAMILGGTLAGFACGVKLTNVPMLLAAAPSVFVMTAIVKRQPLGTTFRAAAVFMLAGLLAFSPWLVRNWLWAGNPVFPEAMALLGRGHFSLVQMQRWANAYRPDPVYASFPGHLRALLDQFVLDVRYGFVLLPAAITAMYLSRRAARSRFLMMLMLLIAGIWIGFTHLQSRFLVLEIPLAALLIGQISHRLFLRVAGCACACLALFTFVWILRRTDLQTILVLNNQASQSSPGGVLGRVFNVRPFDPAMAGERDIFLVGDAYPFCYFVPSDRLRYRTVFDVDTSVPGRSLVESWIASEGAALNDRLIVIDPGELQRFARTYPPIAPFDRDELLSLWSRPDVYVEGAPEFKPAR